MSSQDFLDKELRLPIPCFYPKKALSAYGKHCADESVMNRQAHEKSIH